jgi:hypothetical protein
MKKIFIRSPYFIRINETGQLGSKVELYLYNKGESVPTSPTYILSKKIASTTQTENTYNIANYAKEYIKPIYPDTESDIAPEDNNTWAYCLVKTYTELTLNTYTLLDEETFVCLNGYTSYSGGYNNDNDNTLVVLANPNIKIYKSSQDSYINIFTDVNTSTQLLWSNDTDSFDVDIDEPYLLKLPILSDGLWTLEFDGDTYNFNVEELCEPKYTPIECTFINRFGGWQYLTFFKANLQSIETTNKDFNLLPSSVDYNPLQGQKRTFNQQGKQKIKCNTGWVDENYFDLIQDLFLSEVVLLDNKPVIVKTQSSERKTHLKDKNINYEIEFEYNFGLINDVI